MELLSPAGSFESLVMACEAGADAVYFSGKSFGARAYSNNFDDEETKKALGFLRLRNIKSYITVNTMIKDSEFDKAIDWIKFIYEEGVDGIIVQDIGLIYAIKELFPNIEIHASTQMSVGSVEGAMMLKNMGVNQVVLGRETPIYEIKKIRDSVPIKTEVFSHGALCMSISGKCLLSSIIGGRSGNRGRCAQACRNIYQLINNGNLIGKEGYYLSPKDLMTLEELDRFKELKIDTLKIEGRMKRPEYVYIMTSIYRKAIDGNFSEKDIEDCYQIFNRGFTKGFMFNEFGKDFLSGDRPDNRGVSIGKIINQDKNNILLKLYKDLEKGDGISYIAKDGSEKGFNVGLSGKEGEEITLKKPRDFGNNREIIRTSSMALLNRHKEAPKRIYRNICFEFIAVEDEPLILNMSLFNSDISISVYSDYKATRPITQGVSTKTIRELLFKTNDTVYQPLEIKVSMKEDLFFPLKAVNQLRRAACDEMDLILLQISNRSTDDLINDRIALYNSLWRRDHSHDEKRLFASIKNLEQLYKLSPEKIDRVYAPFWHDDLLKFKERFLTLPLYPKNVPEGEFNGIKLITLDGLEYVLERQEYNNLTLILGEEFNLANPYAISYIQAFWVDEFCPSSELREDELISLSGLGIPMEMRVYGRIPVMYIRNCPFSGVKGCTDESECGSCKYTSNSELIDRIGKKFPIERRDGISILYNSDVSFLYEKLDRVERLTQNIRLDFVDELDEIPEIIDLFYERWIKENIIESPIIENIKQKGFTYGHFSRGVE